MVLKKVLICPWKSGVFVDIIALFRKPRKVLNLHDGSAGVPAGFSL